jgi:hypothetical protein
MSEVRRKGKRHVKTIGSWNLYEYKSPGVNFPNEGKKGEELAELSGGVEITTLSKGDMERYLKNRPVGKLSKVQKQKSEE